VLEVAFTALAIASSGGALWLYGLIRRERARVWLAAAKSAGLADVTLLKPLLWGQSVVGRSGTLRIRIESHRRDREHQDTRVVVDDLDDGFGGVTLGREGTATELAKLFGSREIEIGDPSFDEAFFIGGTPALVYAFLDAETRAVLLRMNEEGVLELASSELRLDIPENEEGRLLSRVPVLLLGVAQRLRHRSETAERLAHNVRNDPRPVVRLRNLLCLIREFGEHPVVAETLRAACEDRNPEVRLRAAIALGRDGFDSLLGMTEDLGMADVWQAAAVSALGRRFTIERAKEALERALRGHRFETARACIEVLGTGDEAAVEPLMKALAVGTGVVAAAAASALGALRAPSAEAPLIRALWREAAGLRVAAAEALGRSGSTAAVLSLKQAAERYPEAAFRRAARQAIAEIQARLPGASPGQLSLSATEAGQLSLADAEAGQLSLADGQAGQLSLAEARQRPESGDEG